MIEIKNITKKYLTKTALHNVSLNLPRGEIVGLFGENGAGKTTLLKCILNLLRYSGEITLDGQPISHKNIAAISFATAEHSFFPNLTAKGHMDFYKDHFERFSQKRFDTLIEFFKLPKHKELHAMSTGQKNQFEVIMALSQGADYILMDEPFSGNDLLNREDFYKLLSGIIEPHETLLLSTHLVSEIEHFIGRAVLLSHGLIVGESGVEQLEQQGISLTDYIKQVFNYKSDRIISAIEKLSDE